MTTPRSIDYARKVVSGDIIACSNVVASCKRHLADLERTDIFLDAKAEDRATRFYETILKLNGGQFEGRAFKLHPSQAFIVGSLFGWKRKKSGKRRFRRAYIEMAKGNGKSPLVAGAGLYGLIADNESRAEVYAAASKFDQAKILYRDARAMVQLSPELDRICSITGGDHQPNIAFLDKASFFRPISSEKGQSGPRPHMALCDELHEHTSRDTVEMLERGFKFREQPLLIMITNSGFDKNTICFEEHDHAVKVAHGEIDDDTTFSYVCGLDKGDDPLKDESCWVKANPLLDVTITKEYLRGIVEQARIMPGKRNSILRLHFCVWTEAYSVLIPREVWEPCEVPDLQPDLTKPCFAALDLSYKRDLTACARVWKDGDRYDAIVDFWTPDETLRDREEKDRAPYQVWKENGFLRTTPGAAVEFSHVVPALAEMNAESEITKVAYDRWRIDLMKIALDDAGVNIEMQEFGQGFKDMSPALEALEEVLYNRRLRVRMNPCLRWNVACAAAQTDAAGNRKFAKNKSTGRIDGIVALAMALAVAAKDDNVDINEFLNNPIRG